MKKILLVTPFIFLSCAAIAQTTVHGTVLGYDGKPMKAAHVHLVEPGEIDPFLTVAAAEDGGYSISTEAAGPFLVQFSGVHHQDRRVLLATDRPIDEAIDVRLATERFDEPIGTVTILSEANGFSRSDAKQMIRHDDGTFSMTFPTEAKKFEYQLLLNDYQRNSGTQAVDYKFNINLYELGRRLFYSGYLSVVEPSGGEVTVVFDPQEFVRSIAPSRVSFEDSSSPLAQASRLFDEQEMYVTARVGAVAAMSKEGIDENLQKYDLSAEIEQLSERYASDDPVLQQLVPLIQLYLATWDLPRNPELLATSARRVLERIEPDSYVLRINIRGAQTLYDVQLADGVGDQALKERCKRFIADFMERQSAEAHLNMLRYMLYVAQRVHDEPERKKWYAVLQTRYGDSQDQEMQFLLEQYAKEISLVPGAPAPAFSLASMADPKTVYTNDSFKGRKVLLDFWAVWCGPCVAEMPGLHRLYEQYHAKGLEVLSVSFDKKPQDVTKFRETQWRMPWRHSYVQGGLTSSIAKTFEVQGIPKPILIDGDTGKILAVDGQLRGENLERTLQQVFN